MWAFYVPTMVGVVLLSAFILHRYAAPSVPAPTRAVAAVAWVTSASVVALVPIDVWSTLAGADSGVVALLWTLCYWTTQALTWIVIPVAQCMSDAGDFSFPARLRTALRDLSHYYAAVGAAAVFGVALLLLAGRLRWRELPSLAMVLVNAYGLVAVVLLLGYGLVSIPRTLWRASFPARRLRYMYWRVGNAAERLERAADEARTVAAVVEATAAPMSRRDPLRPKLDVVLAQAEAAAPFKPSAAPRDAAGRVRMDDLADADLDYGCDAAGLAALRRRLTRSTGAYNGVRAQYVQAVQEALRLERESGAAPGGGAGPPGLPAPAPPSLWAAARPWALRTGAAAAAAVGFLIVWSEATIVTGTHPDLSPFSRAIHGGSRSELAVQAITAAPLAYAAAACYRSLFSLGVFPFYRVVRGATEPRSLLANAGQVSRFAAPLAYNYLHVIRMHEYIGEGGRATVFTTKMAPALRDVPLLGASFNTWFPAVVAVYTLMLSLDVAGAVARAVLPARLAFSEDEPDDAHAERGRALVRAEAEAVGRGLGVGAGLASNCAGGLPDASPTRGGGGGPAAAGEAEMAGRWRVPGWGGGGRPAEPQAPSSMPAGTARRLAGVSPLTRSLLRDKYGAPAGGATAGASADDGELGGLLAEAAGAGPGGALDDVFSRLDARGGPGGGGSGRIDDDDGGGGGWR